MIALNRVDLNLLPIALALYDELSVSRAAQTLGMSQPAVSMALRKLRTTFNDPLFVRAPRGVTPTPRAHALIAVARPLVMELQQGILAEEQFNPGVSTRPFTFALSDVGEMVFLPKLLERLRSQAPRAGIRSVSMPPHQIAEGLEKGDIDLTIGYFPDLAGAGHRPSAVRHRRIRSEAALASEISQRFAQPVAAPAGDAAFQRRERRVESRLARGAALGIVDSIRNRPKSS